LGMSIDCSSSTGDSQDAAGPKPNCANAVGRTIIRQPALQKPPSSGSSSADEQRLPASAFHCLFGTTPSGTASLDISAANSRSHGVSDCVDYLAAGSNSPGALTSVKAELACVGHAPTICTRLTASAGESTGPTGCAPSCPARLAVSVCGVLYHPMLCSAQTARRCLRKI
jgi:hypothetical protein